MKRTLPFVVAMLLAADARAVEGYVWPLSAAPGETIALYVSGALMPNDPAQPNIVFNRVTSNASGVLFAEPAPTAGISITSTADQVPNSEKPDRDGPIWPLSGTFTIPTDWPTGYYIATLKAASGASADYRITFVVKPAPSERHRTAILANVNTWNAYNNRYGYSKYTSYPVTSFMRPNPGADLALGTPAAAADLGTRLHLAHAEVWLLKAIEDYLGHGRVDVYSDIDFHNGLVRAGSHVGKYDRLILSTHPEYWTLEMYDNLRAFLNKGGVVLYLGGNGIFETMVYTTNTGGPAITFLNGDASVCCAYTSDDPNCCASSPDPTTCCQYNSAVRIPALFRTTVPLRAERALLGVATTFCDTPQTGHPYVVDPHPPVGSYARGIYDAILDGVVGPGDVDRRIGSIGVHGVGASGHEVDRVAEAEAGYVIGGAAPCFMPATELDTTPAGVVRIAEGEPIDADPIDQPGADMIYYPYPNPPGPDPGGGYVFSVGSINFGQSLLVDSKLRALMDNVLCSGRMNANYPVHTEASGPRRRGECISKGVPSLKQWKGGSTSVGP